MEQVFGTIDFYLAHEQEIDFYLEEAERVGDARAEEINARAHAVKPELFERLERARQEREAARR